MVVWVLETFFTLGYVGRRFTWLEMVKHVPLNFKIKAHLKDDFRSLIMEIYGLHIHSDGLLHC